MTVFFRVWKKWGTLNRELDVNLDALSLVGAMPADIDVQGPPGAGGVSVNFAAPSYPVAGWSYTIRVDSSNDVGVTSLSLYDNGALVGTVGYDVGPLSLSHDFVWTPATPGRHKLKAIAIDAAGAIADGFLIKQAGTTVYTTKQVPDKYLSPLEEFNAQLKDRYVTDGPPSEEPPQDGGPGDTPPDAPGEAPPPPEE